jgi:hypothetical protein
MRYHVPFFVILFVLSPFLPAAQAEGLVVHEWGVWVRGQTSQGTCLSAPAELLQNLPPFVFRLAKEYSPRRQDHGWNKPVLHLYGPDGLAVTVRIMTPQGRLTAYYPGPQLLDETATITSRKEMMVYSLTDCTGLEWTGTLANQEPNKLPPTPPGHWWEAARKVPGAYIKTVRGTERFLFYEATAFQEPLLRGQVKEQELVLTNTHEQPCGSVLVLLNDGRDRFLRTVENIPGKGELRLARADLLKEPCGDERILQAARAQWESFGLTREEAAAIVEAWRVDLLNTPGFLVISRLPSQVYDSMFPLTVTPAPGQIVRAGVIFDTLPAEAERLNWLPALKTVLETWAKDLEHEEFEVRERAVARFVRLGDLPMPLLEKLAQSDHPETQAAARGLLDRLKPAEAALPLLKAGRKQASPAKQ